LPPENCHKTAIEPEQRIAVVLEKGWNNCD
jgi:hypothetical protein